MKVRDNQHQGDYISILNLTTFIERKERDIIDRKASGELTAKEAEILLTGDVEVYFSDFMKKREEENWSTDDDCLRFRNVYQSYFFADGSF